MEFALTEEQKLLQQTVRQFALEKLLPNYARWDRGERFAKAGLKELATLSAACSAQRILQSGIDAQM